MNEIKVSNAHGPSQMKDQQQNDFGSWSAVYSAIRIYQSQEVAAAGSNMRKTFIQLRRLELPDVLLFPFISFIRPLLVTVCETSVEL